MQSLVKRELIHMIQCTTGGHALGEAGDGDAFKAQEIIEVAGGGLTLDIGTDGEDDFIDLQLPGPVDE
jgi:hypothetical protein